MPDEQPSPSPEAQMAADSIYCGSDFGRYNIHPEEMAIEIDESFAPLRAELDNLREENTKLREALAKTLKYLRTPEEESAEFVERMIERALNQNQK